MLKLRNGSEMPEVMVNVLHMAFTVLIEKNPIAAYELVMKCRDENHEIFGNMDEILKNLKLMEQDNTISANVKNVVLSSAEGEDLDMKFVSPFAKQEVPQSTNNNTLEATDELKAYAQKIYSIGQFVVDTMIENGAHIITALKTEDPNPCYNQIPFNGGLAIQHPGQFWTPFGQVEITRGGYYGDTEKILEILTEKLGLTEALPENSRISSDDDHAVYIVTKDLEGNPMPAPDLTNKRVGYMANHVRNLDHDAARKIWAAVKPSALAGLKKGPTT